VRMRPHVVVAGGLVLLGPEMVEEQERAHRLLLQAVLSSLAGTG
jgi:hypothetical protein